MRRLVMLLSCALVACSAPSPTTPATGREASLAWYAARTDALRLRVTVLRGSLGAALDSLPVASAPHRVAIEARALMQAADSLALLTAQERTLCRAKP